MKHQFADIIEYIYVLPSSAAISQGKVATAVTSCGGWYFIIIIKILIIIIISWKLAAPNGTGYYACT